MRQNIVQGQRTASAKLNRARELRRDMTQAEAMLWRHLRKNRLGLHFRRQQVIDGFIVDFYCSEAALIIEVDGGIHAEPDQIENDIRRTDALTERGLCILRVSNWDIEQDIDGVLARIAEACAGRTPS